MGLLKSLLLWATGQESEDDVMAGRGRAGCATCGRRVGARDAGAVVIDGGREVAVFCLDHADDADALAGG